MKKQKVVLTGGKFNRIHPGHVWLLKKAKRLGYLIVVLAHDSHNRRAYVLPSKARKRNLEKLGIADKVVVGSPKSFVAVVKKFRPGIIILGYDQKMPDMETSEYAKNRRIKIIRFRKHKDYSTRGMTMPDIKIVS